MANVAGLSPDAKEEDEIDDATGDRGRSRHGGIHFGEVGRESHGPTPLHVVGEDFGMECVDGTGWLQCRGENVRVHVSAIVA